MDGAWKQEKKRKIWEAAIAWKNTTQGSREERASRIFANSVLQTEAYAILQAMKDMQWRCPDLIIKTDNLEVVQVLLNDDRTDKRIDSILREIKNIASTFHFFFHVLKLKEKKLN